LVWDPINNDYFYHTFIVGNDTIHYSNYEEVTATFIPRMIMNNYRNPVFYIFITEINEEVGVKEMNSSKVEVFPNPAYDAFSILSRDQTITHIDVLDSKGCLVISKMCNDSKIQFGNLGTHGFLFMRIELSNGDVVSKKIAVR
jgi:hypothetical protein